MPMRHLLSFCTLTLFLLSTINFAYAEVDKSSAEKSITIKNKPNPIDPALLKEAEALKKQIIELNSELYKFEEDLLYPTNTQLGVFLSIASENTFILDSIELRLDDKLISSHLYKENEIVALKKGGIQRLYLGSLSDGRHKLTAKFNGQGANNRYFRRKKALPFTKGQKAKFIQLVVTENSSTHEPLFKVKQW